MIGLAPLAAVEIWRPAPGWPAYEVSDRGRVRRGPRILTPTPKPSRAGVYLVVKLCSAGRPQQVRLHRLVALTWHGPPPRGRTQVDHTHTDPFINRAWSLQWVSQGENQRRSHAVHPRRRDERGRILAKAVAA